MQLTTTATGNTDFSFNLPIRRDGTPEGNETFTVTLSGQTVGMTFTTPTADTATTTIANNDMTPLGTWAITPETLTVNEGDQASYTVRYTSANSQEQGSTVSILVTVGFTAPADANDIDGVPGTPGLEALNSMRLATIIGPRATPGPSEISARVELTIDAMGEAIFSVDLPIADDTEPEEDQTFTVTLSGQTSMTTFTTNTADTATTMIAANDMTPGGTWTISTTTPTVTEGEQARYTVQYTNSNPVEQGVTVSILVTVEFPEENGAAEDDFFNPPDSRLDSNTLASGISERTATPRTAISARVELTTSLDSDGTVTASFSIVLPIFNDPAPEDAETFTVTLSGEMTGTTFTTNTATTTIAANDMTPGGTWTITSDTPTVNEGEQASYTVQYTSNNPVEQGSTVSILVAVNISDPEVMAEDFDPTLTSATLSDAISGGTPTPRTPISARVELTTSLDSDGNVTASFSVVLPIRKDGITEGDETFTVRISEQTPRETTMIDDNADTATTMIVANDLTPGGTWIISNTTTNVVEGDFAIYTVQYNSNDPDERGASVSILVTVELSTTTGTEYRTAQANDFDLPLTPATLSDAISGGTVTDSTETITEISMTDTTITEISATVSLIIGTNGIASFSVVLPIANDTAPEDNETFMVIFSGQTPGTDFPTNTATTTIAINDLTWEITPKNLIVEGDFAIYTVHYTGIPIPEGHVVRTRVTVEFDTADADDFVFGIGGLLNSGNLLTAIAGIRTGLIGPSLDSPVVSVDLPIGADGTGIFTIELPIRIRTTREVAETFRVRIDDPFFPTPGTTFITATSSTTIPANNPSGTWAIRTTTSTVNEGESARYIVQYTGTPDKPGDTAVILVTVNLGTTASTAQAIDFNPTLNRTNLSNAIRSEKGTITRSTLTRVSHRVRVALTTAVNGNGRFTITLPILDDMIPEVAETFTVTLSGETIGTTPITNPTATTMITANDSTPEGTWTISPTTTTVNEGDQASYTVRYMGNPAEQGSTVEIRVTVNINDSVLAEDFIPSLVNSAALESAIRNGIVIEGTRTDVTGNTGISATVELTIGTNGNASFSFVLTIRSDGTTEGPETFMVTLSEPTTDTMIDTATTTIADIDLGGTWTITPENQTVNERETASYTVRYMGTPTEQGAPVSILVTVGFPPENPAQANDFDPFLENSAVFANLIGPTATAEPDSNDLTVIRARMPLTIGTNGNASFSFDLTIIDDVIREGDETFTVTLSGQTTGTRNPNPTATTTIIDNDLGGTWTIISPTPTVNEMETARYTVRYMGTSAEQGETVSILVTVGFTGENPADADDIDGDASTEGPQRLTSVHLRTLIGGRVRAGDTNVISATVFRTIDAMGDVSFRVDLPIFNDQDPEDDETFTVTLSQRSTGSIDTSTVTTTIAANDITPRGIWTIRSPTRTVNEGDDANYTIQYRAGNPAERGSRVSILVTVGFTTGTGQADANDFAPPLVDSAAFATLIGDEATPDPDPTVIRARVTLTIGTNGRVSVIITLPIADDDDDDEENETFTVEFSRPSEETTTLVPNPTILTTTIADEASSTNDIPRGTWEISTTPTTVNEDGTVNEGETVTYTVQYNRGSADEQGERVSIDMTVEFPAADPAVDPAEPDDLRPIPMSASLRAAILNPDENDIDRPIAEGTRIERENIRDITSGVSVAFIISESASASFSFDLLIFDDLTFEPAETFTFRLEIPDEEMTRLVPDSATATTTIAVSDNTGGVLTISHISPVSSPFTVEEGENIRYEVRYDGAPGPIDIQVTIDWSGENTAEAEDFDAVPDMDGVPETTGRQPLTSVHLVAIINNNITAGRARVPDAEEEDSVSAITRLTILAASSPTRAFFLDLRIFNDNVFENAETFTIRASEQLRGEDPQVQAQRITTINTSDLSGNWEITSEPPTVNENDNENDQASYTVAYDGPAAERGARVSILVTVGFPSNQAMADDIDGVPRTPDMADTLTSAHLLALIAVASNTDVDTDRTTTGSEISAMVTLTIDANGNAEFSFDLTIADDDEEEGDETFMVALSEHTPGTNIIISDVTTTIAANDSPPTGNWAITPDTQTVHEGESARYTVQYTGASAAEQGSPVSILVTVEFPPEDPAVEFPPEDPASDADIDGDPDTEDPDTLISAHLVALIEVASNTDVDTDRTTTGSEISAMVTLTIDTNGNARFEFELTIANDTDQERDETFTVTLSIPSREMTMFATDSTGATNLARATTTIAASDRIFSGRWTISQDSTELDSSGDPIFVTVPVTVNEVDDARSRYTVQYTGDSITRGETVSILVTVNLGTANTGTADPDDFIPNLTSESLATLIGSTATAEPDLNDLTLIRARVSLTIDDMGDASVIFDLPIANDNIEENAETFTVMLSEQTPDTTMITTDRATTTIAANDSPPLGEWTITPETLTVNEGDDASYTVRYMGNPAEQGSTASIQVTVNLGTTPGTAEDDDFIPSLENSAALVSAISGSDISGTPMADTSGTVISATVNLTIGGDGNASFSVDLTISSDGEAEGDETFTVTLSGEMTGTTFTTNTATTTIADSDLGGTWTITPDNQTVNEPVNDPGNENDQASYTVEYEGPPAEQGATVSIQVTVNLGIVGNTENMADANDFDADPSPSEIQPLTSATLASAINGDDLSGNPTPTADTDFTAISAMVTLTIDANGNAEFGFDLTIADDDDEEGDETFTVTLSRQTTGTRNPNPDANTTIAANDSPPRGTWTISQTPTGPVNEGEYARYTVQYEGASADPSAEQGSTVSILVTVGFPEENGADENDFNPSLVDSAALMAFIGDGATAGTDTNVISARVSRTIGVDGTASVIITLPIEEDGEAEGDETFTVTFSEQTRGTTLDPPTILTTTIADSDLGGTWTITPDNQTVNEPVNDPGNENDQASYTVAYTSDDPTEQGATVSIVVTVGFTAPADANDIDGVPDIDSDSNTEGPQRLTSAHLVALIAVASNIDVDPDRTTTGSEISAMVTLTIDANGNAEFSFDLTIADDDDEEGDETFTVTLSRQTTGTRNPNPDANTTIAANDSPPRGTWTISQTPTGPVNEGEYARYTVQYEGASADPSAEQGSTVSILVTVEFTLGPGQADADDFETPLVNSAALMAFIGDGATAGTDTNVISARVSRTIGVDGTASVIITLPIEEDGEAEGDETFTVTFSRQTMGTTLDPPTTVTTTIADSDLGGTWNISQTPTGPVNEGDDASYTVEYDGASASATQGSTVLILVTVRFTGANRAAEDDFFNPPEDSRLDSAALVDAINESNPGDDIATPSTEISARVSLTIDDMEENASFIITLPIFDDDEEEGDEFFTVILSEVSTRMIAVAEATTTINANDPSGTWTISTTTPTVNEGETARYTVLYTGTSATQVTVSILVTVELTGENPAEEDDFFNPPDFLLDSNSPRISILPL